MRRTEHNVGTARCRGTLPAACLSLLGGLLLLGGCGALGIDEATGPLGGIEDRDVDPSTGLTCLVEKQGGPTSCKDEATWKNYAAMFCAS
jgi:hypothetical protein